MYDTMLLQETNKHLSDTERIILSFYKGFHARFKKQYGLSFRRIHGESLRADNASIAEYMPRLMRIITTYSDCDI